MTPQKISLFAIPNVPLIAPGDDLGNILASAMMQAGLEFVSGDVLTVAQKIISKAEGRYFDLATVKPSQRARKLGQETQKDPRLVELILSQSRKVVRHKPGVIVVEHTLGFIMANAGIDRSNVEGPGERVLLLPVDPDASCWKLRSVLEARYGVRIGVVMTDSFGRPWRLGTVGTAIGTAGVPPLVDMRGRHDLFGHPLQVTEVGLADEIAAGASLIMGQAAEATPAVIVRGIEWVEDTRGASTLCRPQAEDMFR